MLAYEHCEGITLARTNPGCTDGELGRIWDTVTLLHDNHVTHRALTADRIMFTKDERVVLLDPGDGDVAASELQIRLDLAQLIVELALYVGPEKSAQLAIEKVGASELMTVLPLLQPVVLVRSTRHALRRRRDVLPAVRKALLEAVPGGEVTPVQLERIRARTLVTLVASVAAVYLLAGELAQASFGHLLRSADWRWALVALGLSAATYVGATLSLSGFVAERLSFARTLLVQLASSFITLVTPAAVGGAALNVRYLQRRRIPAPVAVASVGVVAGGGLRAAHPAAHDIRRDRRSRKQERDQAADLGLLRRGRACRAGRRGARRARRAAHAAGAPVADLRPGAAAAA